ncbi:hypothetical protein P691DRAFT_801356 [Macrolepiota fuliginosa MF-IS2]|uniref:Uncharacterized protein n=1 Tax=Macrolepiota fuliginosa MF-IS2 TaxID=1400762 RepID=A0A9P6BWP7_9AGAR|nr:hypothetical protein P691DRAFT_801356 [Macrolepiota fuliginosa MF-IS2]
MAQTKTRYRGAVVWDGTTDWEGIVTEFRSPEFEAAGLHECQSGRGYRPNLHAVHLIYLPRGQVLGKREMSGLKTSASKRGQS